MSGKRRGQVIAMAAMTLIVTTAATHGNAAPTKSRAPSATSSRGWARAIVPLTQPVAAGDRLVLVTLANIEPRLTALDPTTGRTIWSHPEAITGGFPAVLATSDRTVELKPQKTGPLSRLVGLRASDGHALWHTETLVAIDAPRLCPGSAAIVCVEGIRPPRVHTYRIFRFRLSSGQPLTAQVAPAGDTPLISGGDLYGRGNAPIPPAGRVTGTNGQRPSWTRTISSLFSLATADAVQITWFASSAMSTYLGGLLVTPTGAANYDLSRTTSVGFSTASGGVRWRNRGSLLACFYLPCKGESLDLNSTPRVSRAAGIRVGVRLRMHGHLAANPTNGLGVSSDATVGIEGFNPRTGHTVWSYADGHDTELIGANRYLPQSGPHTVLLPNDAGALAELDLNTGRTQRVGSTKVGWCRALDEREAEVNGQMLQALSQFFEYPCRSNQRLQTRSLPSRLPAFLGSIGAHSQGLIVISQANRVIARPSG